ncbi:MAG: DUF951 domain-containing protein [Clostridia bacterium]|nr:DUF951 domain-containing protein [Clostridia bacterium]
MPMIRFEEGDTLKMKKKHPCSCDLFEVLRTGSDVRIRCKGCSRDLTLPRIKLEAGIKAVIQKKQEEKEHE